MNQFSTLWAAPALKRTAFALLFLSIVGIIQAQKSWDGGGDGVNWSSGNNWNPNGVPAATDAVTIGAFNITINASASAASLTLNSGATLNVNNNLTIRNGGFITINSGGSIVFNSTARILGGSTGNNNGVLLTVNSGANLTTANLAGFTTSSTQGTILEGSFGINIGNNPTRPSVYGLGVNYTYNGADGQVTGNALVQANNLTISNSGTKSTSNSITVTGLLTVNSPAVFAPSATHTISRSATLGGALAGNGTIRVTGLGAINSLFTQYPIYSGFVPAIENLTVDYAGNGNQTVNSVSYGALRTSVSGIKTVGGEGGLKVLGNLTVSAPTTFDVGDNAAENPNQGTGALVVENGATLRVGGTKRLPANFGSYNFQPTSTVVFYGGAHNIFGRTFGHLVLENGTTVTPINTETISGDVTIVGDLTIGNGATLNGTDGDDRTHRIRGNWTNNNGFYNASGKTQFIFEGSALQTIGGAANSKTTFENLVVNNPQGITLNQTVEIGADGGDGTLTFGVDGAIINSSANSPLVFLDNSTYTGESNLRFVNGPVRKVGNDNFTFPIGKRTNDAGSGYHPLRITVGGPITTNAFTAEYIRASATQLDPTLEQGGELKAVSNCEYWELTRNAGAINPQVTLYWSENSPCGSTYIVDPAAVAVAHLKNGEWHSHGNEEAGEGSSAQNGRVRSVNEVTDLGNTLNQFTLGSTNGALAPLPVTFTSFEGKKVSSGTQLTWKVAGEINVKEYEVERSSRNNGGFTKIGAVPANGASAYSFTDGALHNNAVFYRIKNVDADGQFRYSTILAFRNGAGVMVFRIVPTVVSTRTAVEHGTATGSENLALTTVDGRVISTVRPATGSIKTDVDMTNLRPGMYLLRWSDGKGSVETTKVVKQ